MKKYILSAVAIIALASCNSPAGGNKNTIKITKDVSRYSDDMEPAATEPNFGATANAATNKVADSTKKAAPVKAVKDSAAVKPAEEAKK